MGLDTAPSYGKGKEGWMAVENAWCHKHKQVCTQKNAHKDPLPC